MKKRTKVIIFLVLFLVLSSVATFLTYTKSNNDHFDSRSNNDQFGRMSYQEDM